MVGSSVSSVTAEALRLLGGRVGEARRSRRMTISELAERVGVSMPTIRKVEAGDPTVAIGTAFEAAAVLGVALFDADPARRRLEAGRIADRLAVLPTAVRPRSVDDDF